MKKRIFYVDFIRTMGAFAIIMIHVSTNYSRLPFVWWWITCFVLAVFYWAVPVFFIISGSFYLDSGKRLGWKKFFKGRIFKILIPLLFWGLFYVFFYQPGLFSATNLKELPSFL